MMWIIYALLSAGTASLVAIFSKIGAPRIDSTTATTIRSIIMTAFLVTTSLLLKRLNPSYIQTIPYKDLLFIALSGLMGALSWLFYFAALKIGHVHNVVAIDRLSLVMVALLSMLLLGETINAREWIGIACMTAGAFLLIH